MSLTRAIKKQGQATTKVRETRLGRMALVLLLLGLEACAAPEQSFATRPTSSPRPNVVFMMADNLGFADVGAFGGGEMRGMPTPRLDQMAAEGLQLTQFLVEPGCTPSRSAFMTGRYSIRSGLSLVVLRGTGNTLADEERTLAEVLSDAGYDTAMYGKWHLGMEPQSHPQNQGFDEWYGILNSTDEVIYADLLKEAKIPGVAPHKIDIVEAKKGEDLRAVERYTPERRRTIDLDLTKKAEEYIANHRRSDTPFFLFVSFTRPHFPNLPSKKFEGASRIGDYGDSVMELDDNVGRVIDAVDRAGLTKKTLIVFVSDNGPMRSVLLPHDGGWGGMYRGELGTPYEGSLRTPAIVRWPGQIAPRVSNEMVSIMDWAPTIASLAGAAMPADRPIDGLDATEFLLGKSKASPRDHLLTFIGEHLVALRFRQFRVYYKDFVDVGTTYSQGGTSSRLADRIYPLVYNIEADPRELRDIGVYQAGLATAAFRFIAAYKKSVAQYPNPPAPNMTEF